MANRRKREEYLFLMASVDSQEVQLGSSGDGSQKYPRHIGTYIELTGTLQTPLNGVSPIAVSISEVEGSLQDSGLRIGMIHAVKPVVTFSLWADRPAVDRLLVLIAAKRLTDFHANIERPRYGKAWVLNWSLRTAPEEG